MDMRSRIGIQAQLLSQVMLLGILAGSAMAEGTVPRFEEAACPFASDGIADIVRCGNLVVAENRAVANGRTLSLAVAVIRSSAASPRPDPLVFLSGGPGGSSVEFVPRRVDQPFWNRFRQDRDLIFFDQRGTGFSDPEFCPELNVTLYTASFRGLPVDELRKVEREAVLDCRSKMLAKGIDFSAYNSSTSARDLDELRQALGYESWNLFGVSYGTRLALSAMRETPAGIRSVVLDSVSPPNSPVADISYKLMRSLRLVFDQCADDEHCHAAFPTLEADFFDIISKLEVRPVEVAMTDRMRFPDGRIVIDGTVLAVGVFQGLYDQSFVPFLPLLIRELRAGNKDLLYALADNLVEDPQYLSQGLRYAVDCFELIPFATPQELVADRANYPQLAAFQEFSDEQAICDAWHTFRAEPAGLEGVTSDIPALIAAGEFDPITPPFYARLAAASLPNATLFEVNGAGHGVVPFTACAQSIMQAFLDNPDSTPDTSCVASLERADFITAVHANPGIYRLARLLQEPLDTAMLVGLGLMLLLIVSSILVWPAAWLKHRQSRKSALPSLASKARTLEFAIALLVVLFLAGLAWAIMAAMQQSYYLPAVGVPALAAPVFLLPWFIAVLTCALAIFVVLAWRHKWWGITGSIYFSLVAAACAGFVFWAASMGLM